jgi:hypothetical protein
MIDNKIHELIEELKALKLREAEIIEQLAVENVRRNREARENGARLVRRTTTGHGFEQGDRIRITNQVKKPYNWGDDHWNYHEARIATVTFTTPNRIHFVTDNGLTTWRAPRNIERIQ